MKERANMAAGRQAGPLPPVSVLPAPSESEDWDLELEVLGCPLTEEMTVEEWKDEHPTKPGLYWVSVEPKLRPPCHREKAELPPVFLILITPSGDVFELEFEKPEPTYNVSNLPSSVNSGVKYASVLLAKPADPWA